MSKITEGWKNSNVFKKQLELNLQELSSPHTYPPHWKDLISLLSTIQPKNMLDVGCGCGALYVLCKREFPTLKYTGIDYSPNAIDIAKQTWQYNGFFVKNCLSLDGEYIQEYDLIHLGALLDVLPNGDEVLKYVLSLGSPNVILGRVKMTKEDSYYHTYIAYGEITTCAYYHNEDNFMKSCEEYGYGINKVRDSFYLKKK